MWLKRYQQFFIWVKSSDRTNHRIQFCWVVCIIIYINFSVFKSMFGITSFNSFETRNSFLNCRKICSQIVQNSNRSCCIFYIMRSWNLPSKFYGLFARMKIKHHPTIYNVQIIRIIIRFFIHSIRFTRSANIYAFSHEKLVVFWH